MRYSAQTFQTLNTPGCPTFMMREAKKESPPPTLSGIECKCNSALERFQI